MDQICFTCSIAPDAAEHSALAAEHTQTAHADTGHTHHALPQARYRPALASNVWHNRHVYVCVRIRCAAARRAAAPRRCTSSPSLASSSSKPHAASLSLSYALPPASPPGTSLDLPMLSVVVLGTP